MKVREHFNQHLCYHQGQPSGQNSHFQQAGHEFETPPPSSYQQVVQGKDLDLPFFFKRKTTLICNAYTLSQKLLEVQTKMSDDLTPYPRKLTKDTSDSYDERKTCNRRFLSASINALLPFDTQESLHDQNHHIQYLL